MSWFSKTPRAHELEHLVAKLERLESELKNVRGEMDELHTRVHRWMRRAVAAESSPGRAPSQIPAAQAATLAAVPGIGGLWGARRRIALREFRRRLARPTQNELELEESESAPPASAGEEGTNGVHP